ncbi:MAG TPA: 6-carboxytetrahydropterin synthase [Bacteroidia bacterium]|nr:6-carboxytetrahydropterin synthase [Bacteroidia bacterium]
MKTSVYRKSHFNSAHRLHNPSLSDIENERLFGKCNRPNYHGHNYELIVKVTGEIDPISGYVIDMKVLADLVKEHIEEKFDHRNLNLDTKEFANLNPTAENIARVIYEILRKQIAEKFELSITLFETDRNFVKYPG